MAQTRTSGEGTLEVDTFFIEESGNDVYKRSISAKGCLRDIHHKDYREKQQAIIDSRSTVGIKSKELFDSTTFSIDEVRTFFFHF